jgi:hypothetical protein
LVRAAQHVAAAERELHDAIRAAAAAGMSLRDMEEPTRVSRGTLANIIHANVATNVVAIRGRTVRPRRNGR